MTVRKTNRSNTGGGTAVAPMPVAGQVLTYKITIKEGNRTIRDGTYAELDLAQFLRKWNSIVPGLVHGETATFTVACRLGNPPARS
jgi:hypothetical protein